MGASRTLKGVLGILRTLLRPEFSVAIGISFSVRKIESRPFLYFYPSSMLNDFSFLVLRNRRMPFDRELNDDWPWILRFGREEPLPEIDDELMLEAVVEPEVIALSARLRFSKV